MSTLLDVETFPTAEAAALLGVNVAKFFRLTAKHNVYPVLEAPGARGAKFWNPRDIDRIAEAEGAEVTS